MPDCITTPHIDAVPATPGYVQESPNEGWNAGATSVAVRSGNCYFRFEVSDATTGVIAGFAPYPRSDSAAVANLSHAFQLLNVRGFRFAQVIESGVARGEVIELGGFGVFELQRVGPNVFYLIDGSIVYASGAPSVGALQAGAVMYLSGDEITDAEFEPLTSGALASGSGDLGMSGFGGDFLSGGWGEIVFVGVGKALTGGGGSLALDGIGGVYLAGGHGAIGLGGQGVNSVAIPTVAAGYGDLGLEGYGVGFSKAFGDADGSLDMGGFGGDFSAGGWGAGELRGRGSEDLMLESLPFFLVQSPGLMYMTVGYDEITLADSIAFTDMVVGRVAWVFESSLRLADAAVTRMDASSSFADSVAFNDVVHGTVMLIANSALALTDDPTITLHALLSASSTLQLSDEALGSMSGNIIAASIFVLISNGAMARELFDDFESSIEFTDSIVGQVRALAAVLDTLELSDTAEARMFAFGTVSDTVSFADATTGILSGNLDVFDTLMFTGVIRWLGDPYSVYSVSLDNQAVSEYENYNFNSFAVINGEAYGMGAAGVYNLEGADDAGEPINSRVRTGLNNLGTALKKRVPNVYVGYTTTGVLALKVVTTDSGVKKANYYTLRPLPKSDVTDNRFDVAKGLSSVYWQFEIANEDGAGFELDEVRAWRMLTNRRK